MYAERVITEPSSGRDTTAELAPASGGWVPAAEGSVVRPVDPASDPVVGLELSRSPSRFRSEGLLAKGGTSSVLAVFDPVLRRRAAMKVLHADLGDKPHAMAAFVREAQLTSQLSHPGVVPVYELGRDATMGVYFTMKLILGESLRSFVRRHAHDPWSPRVLIEFTRVLGSVCEVLSYAHRGGTVHCDVKPDNIMVGPAGEPYLLDWGIARSGLRGSLRRGPPAQPRTVVGTPTYMSPEQARGLEDEIGPSSDVFALGAMTYEFLVGETLYVGATSREILKQAQRGVQGIPERSIVGDRIPDSFRELLRSSTAERPEHRHPSAEAFHRALVAAVAGLRRD